MSKRHLLAGALAALAIVWFAQGMCAWWTHLTWGGLCQALILAPLIAAAAFNIYFQDKEIIQ